MRTWSSPAHCSLNDWWRREGVSRGRDAGRGRGSRRRARGWEAERGLTEQTGLLRWLRTKPPAGRKICVRHFCNSKRLSPAFTPTVNESKPGMALPVSRLSPGSAHQGTTPLPWQASWNPPSSPEGRLALRRRVCHRQRPDAGSLRVEFLASSSACSSGLMLRRDVAHSRGLNGGP